MRIVVDTNLLVSGVISVGGLPRQLLDAAKGGEFELCTSEMLLAELLDVLSREKFAAQSQINQNPCRTAATTATTIAPTNTIRIQGLAASQSCERSGLSDAVSGAGTVCKGSRRDGIVESWLMACTW